MSRIPPFEPGLLRPRTKPASHLETSNSLDDVAGWLSSLSDVSIVSLDVFDTVITRACGESADLFLWLGRRLALRVGLPVSPEVFARARARAEANVWYREGGMDSRVDLVEIHTELVRNLGLDPLTAEELAEAEFDLEQEVSRPIPGMDRLRSHVNARDDMKIVMTSDTYLTGRQVQELLSLHHPMTGVRHLVSSDLAASKASGRSFDVLLAETGQGAGAVLHCGDNPHSDVDVPRSMGMRAAWLPAARVNRYERQLSKAAWATGGLSAAFAGASRQARLSIPAANAHEAAIRDVAAGVASPVLVGYVMWVLRRAQHHGLGRVAFLARDGQIMAAIARRLVARLGLDLQIDYLPASRQSTNLAATFDLEDDATDWAFRDARDLTLRQFLDRFDLTPEDVRWHLIGEGDPHALLGDDDVSTLRVLIEADEVRERVLERAAARRQMVLAFLDQHELVGAAPVGIVDFGGVGSQVRALHELLVHAGAPPPRIFLVGLDDPVEAGLSMPEHEPDWLDRVETWLYDHRRGRGIRRARGFGTCVQMFCAADHGTVTGYREVEGQVVAELATERDQPVLDWGLDILQQSVQRVVDELVLDEDLVDLDCDLREISTRLVDLFWSDPEESEAAAWGLFPFEGAQATGSRPRPLAHGYSLSEIFRGVADATFPNLGWQHWYEGSLRLSPGPVRHGLRLAERAFYALRATRGPVGSRLVDWARERRP